MTSKQFRTTIAIIFLIALLEVLVGVFYYFVFFTPKKQMEELRLKEDSQVQEKQIEQDRLLKEAEMREATRMEEIKMEVKQIDLELERLRRWQEENDEFDKLRLEEVEKKGKEQSVDSCMKIVVENYHNQWNQFCDQLNLPSVCALPIEYAEQINGDYEDGKTQCENFFK